MPFGAFINVIPPVGFTLIHLTLFLVAGYLAFRSYGAGLGGFGLAFVILFASAIGALRERAGVAA